MIHIATIHFKSLFWAEIQVKHIRRYSKKSKIWAGLNSINLKRLKHPFDDAIDVSNECPNPSRNHWIALDKLTEHICQNKEVKDNDIILFLDSDSLIINNLDEYIEDNIKKHKFCAVNRVENDGDKIPHPSFAFCEVGFWKKHNLSWGGCKNPNGLQLDIYDTGGLLYQKLKTINEDWLRIRRNIEKSLFTDGVLFSTYGDIVYHHGAGSRGGFRTRWTPEFVINNWKFFSKIHIDTNKYILQEIRNGYFLK